MIENQQSQMDIRKRQDFEELGIKTNSKAFNRYYNAGLLNNIDKSFIKELRQYWKKHYGKSKSPVFNLAYANLTGERDPRPVSPAIMTNDIVPYFNDPKMRGMYKDKNNYEKLFVTNRAVKTILKRVHGTYFEDNNSIDKDKAYHIILSYKDDMIIKPSNTNNGEGIAKLECKNRELYLHAKKITFDELEEVYGGHFMVQEVIQQHDVIAAPHPKSVNTLRMVTLRWKNKIRYLLTFARFGANNSVQDNAGAGGVCVGVTDTGEFLDTAIDEECNRYTHHPTTNYRFSDLQPIPNFTEFREYVMGLHKQILHHDFVSWDIAVGKDGKPIFLEANFRGATWLYQLAAQKPLFGELTEEILEQVSSEINDENSPRKKVLTEQQKLKKKISKLERKIANLEKENGDLQLTIKELGG